MYRIIFLTLTLCYSAALADEANQNSPLLSAHLKSLSGDLKPEDTEASQYLKGYETLKVDVLEDLDLLKGRELKKPNYGEATDRSIMERLANRRSSSRPLDQATNLSFRRIRLQDYENRPHALPKAYNVSEQMPNFSDPKVQTLILMKHNSNEIQRYNNQKLRWRVQNQKADQAHRQHAYTFMASHRTHQVVK